jgi:formylmethanofuran dehydrogenase subunit E
MLTPKCAFCGEEVEKPTYTSKGKPICDGCREDYSMEIEFGVI